MDISVVIPCYNAGTLVEAAVTSVLCQKGNFVVAQVIVVDDASTDPTTIETLNRLTRLPKIEVYSHKRNKGPGAARNTGIAKVNTKWLAFLDADDVFTENSLEIRLQATRAFPDCSWIGGDFRIWHDGIIEQSFFLARPAVRRYVDRAFATNRPIHLPTPIGAFLDVCLTHMCSSIYLTEAVRSIGGFNEDIRLQGDYHFFMRFAKSFDYVFVPDVVFIHRRHENNLTRSPALIYSWRARALKELINSGEFPEYREIMREKIAGLYLARAYALRESGRFGAATVSSVQSAFYNPRNPATWRCFAAAALRS